MRKSLRRQQLHKRLDEELEKALKIFDIMHPWIQEPEKYETYSATDAEIEEKITNDYAIAKIIEEIRTLS